MAKLRSFRFMFFIGLLGIRQSKSGQSASQVAEVQGLVVSGKIPPNDLKPPKNAYDSSDRPGFDNELYDLQQDQTGHRKEGNGLKDDVRLTRLYDLKRKRGQHDPKVHKHDGSSDQGYEKQKPDATMNVTVSNGTSFEEYERKFLLNKIQKMLEEFLLYNNFQNYLKKNNQLDTDRSPQRTKEITSGHIKPTASHYTVITPTSPVRTDPVVLQHTMNALGQMDITQLTHVFGNLTESASYGTIDGGIASLCCHLG